MYRNQVYKGYVLPYPFFKKKKQNKIMNTVGLLQNRLSPKKKILLPFQSSAKHWSIIIQKRLNSSANSTNAIATIKNKDSLHIPMLTQHSE